MFRWFIFLFCSLALTACSAQTVSPAVTKIAISPPSTQPPSPESPTPVPVTMAELGFTDSNVMSAFNGVESTITREADGAYSVSAISYNQETKVAANYKIDKTTFSINPEIKNAYAPATVQTTDGKTLIWDSEHSNWRLPFAMVDNSDFSKIDQIPFVPEGDQKIAVESALLYFKDHPPFTDAAVESYKKYGGNSLLYEYSPNNGSESVMLKAKGNDILSNLTNNKAVMKFSPLWVYQYINGARQDMPFLLLLDPADSKNPKPDEYKIIFGVGGQPDGLNLTTLDKKYFPSLIDTYYKSGTINGKINIPYVYLYGNEEYQKTHPLLASLLVLPGNKPGSLTFPGYDGAKYNIYSTLDDGFKNALNNPNKIAERPLAEYNPDGSLRWDSLPPEIQTMRLFYSIGINK